MAWQQTHTHPYCGSDGELNRPSPPWRCKPNFCMSVVWSPLSPVALPTNPPHSISNPSAPSLGASSSVFLDKSRGQCSWKWWRRHDSKKNRAFQTKWWVTGLDEGKPYYFLQKNSLLNSCIYIHKNKGQNRLEHSPQKQRAGALVCSSGQGFGFSKVNINQNFNPKFWAWADILQYKRRVNLGHY